MPKTTKKTPSPNRRRVTARRVVFRLNDSPAKAHRRSSPLWRKKTPMPVIRWNSPQPALISTPELVRMQHEKWKADQEQLKYSARQKWMRNIHENKQKGLYLEPGSTNDHAYFRNQQAENFWGDVQRKYDNDMAWASNSVPHFGGRKKKRK